MPARDLTPTYPFRWHIPPSAIFEYFYILSETYEKPAFFSPVPLSLANVLKSLVNFRDTCRLISSHLPRFLNPCFPSSVFSSRNYAYRRMVDVH